MSGALVNLGELSKPATVLIEKISEAVGGVFRPYQVIRVAKAEAEAEKIRASAEIEVEDLHRRALQRFLLEEGAKQQNMEAITSKAVPLLEDSAKPGDLEKDWITNFFDKCRLISDDEMQGLWSRVLAGEAGSPGTFSKRTVNFLASLDKSDAALFNSLCSYGWMIGGLVTPVFDVKDKIYTDRGLNFGSLTQLDSIGLIRFDNLAGFRRIGLPKRFHAFYYGRPLELELPKEADNDIEIGHVLLTKLGIELAPICGSVAHPEFFDYVREKWKALAPKVIPPPESQAGATSVPSDPLEGDQDRAGEIKP